MKSIDKITKNVTKTKFRFAIIADPQIMPRNREGDKPHQSQSGLEGACAELNALDTPIDFLIFLGDIVNTPDEPSYENFIKCTEPITCPVAIVHGNHDSRAPFEPHRKILSRYMGSEDMYYSFDAGKWHFAVLPCFEGNFNEYCEELLSFLKNDLEQNKSKNTILLIHMHAIPQGNSQSEWYCYVLEMRRKLNEIISAYPNIKYYINGHVHPNLKASYKNTRRYNGVTYLSVPSVTRPRPWGEEFPGCVTEDGGNYIIVDVDNEDITFTGRQAYKKAEIIFPKGSAIPEYRDDMEPRWKNLITEIPANNFFRNGSFDSGLEGWNIKYRYAPDEKPHAVQEIVYSPKPAYPGDKCARCYNRAIQPNDWGNDENCEIYQIFKLNPNIAPVVSADYFLKNTSFNGGGFIRFVAMKNDEFKFMMIFKWGKNESRANILPQCYGYELTGKRQGWSFFNELGEKKQGLYFNIDDEEGKWNNININIRKLYNAAVKETDYNTLGINKLMVGLATWINKEAFDDETKYTSEAFFDNIVLSEDCGTEETGCSESFNNGKPIIPDGLEFCMRFGNN